MLCQLVFKRKKSYDESLVYSFGNEIRKVEVKPEGNASYAQHILPYLFVRDKSASLGKDEYAARRTEIQGRKALRDQDIVQRRANGVESDGKSPYERTFSIVVLRTACIERVGLD